MRRPNTFRRRLAAGFATGCTLWAAAAMASVVYDRSNVYPTNFVGFGPATTPGRPASGDHLGNEVTLAGSDRLLTEVDAWFGYGNSQGLVDTHRDDYTVALRKNDGVGGAPGTLIASSTVPADSLGPPIMVRFPFLTAVPNHFTIVLSSSHPTGTWNQRLGIVGPQSANSTPVTGSAKNTIWFNSDPSLENWVSNSTWALADGAPSNYFAMTLQAKPVPPGDANLDGKVDFVDLLVLAQNYGKPGNFDQGDLNLDGVVAFDDLLILVQHYGTADGAVGAVTAVPEPAAMAPAVVAAAALILQHRRPVRRRS